MNWEIDTRKRLLENDEELARTEAELKRLEGERDQLVAELLDLEGAHDRRPVAVR